MFGARIKSWVNYPISALLAFYLHVGDSTQLNGKNSHQWERTVNKSLQAKDY